jgi:hypothetical protein
LSLGASSWYGFVIVGQKAFMASSLSVVQGKNRINNPYRQGKYNFFGSSDIWTNLLIDHFEH